MADRRVLFFGDSLTVGVGDPEGLGWVGRVVAASFESGIPLTAYNLGVRHETSLDVLARWQPEAKPRRRPDADYKVVFSVGVNDAKVEHGAMRVAPEKSLGAMDALLGQAGELKLPALVVGPAAVEDEAHTERIAELSAAFADLCRERQVRFIEIVTELRRPGPWQEEVSAPMADGVHPGAGGYRQLAERVGREGWIDWLETH